MRCCVQAAAVVAAVTVATNENRDKELERIQNVSAHFTSGLTKPHKSHQLLHALLEVADR